MERYCSRTPPALMQTLMTSFAVKTPRFTRPYRAPALAKRPAEPAAKRSPGRPRKRARALVDDFRETWHTFVTEENQQAIDVAESYIDHYITFPSDKPRGTTKFQASYTAERRFEVREYHKNLKCSYQQTAQAFGMPKTTVYDIVNRDTAGEPKRGRGNKTGAGRAGNPLLDYPHWEEEARG